jgi:hypothetical protein
MNDKFIINMELQKMNDNELRQRLEAITILQHGLIFALNKLRQQTIFLLLFTQISILIVFLIELFYITTLV